MSGRETERKLKTALWLINRAARNSHFGQRKVDLDYIEWISRTYMHDIDPKFVPKEGCWPIPSTGDKP